MIISIPDDPDFSTFIPTLEDEGKAILLAEFLNVNKIDFCSVSCKNHKTLKRYLDNIQKEIEQKKADKVNNILNQCKFN